MKITLHIILVLLFTIHSYCGEPVSKLKNGAGFIENKGQIIDQNGKTNPVVLYLLNTPGMNVQLRKGGFSYDLYIPPLHSSPAGKRVTSPPGEVNNKQDWNFHRIDFDFVGYNPDYEVIPFEPSVDYLNYYTAGSPVKGVTFVRSYQKITYKNIYPGIDLEFIIEPEMGFKYTFVIHPRTDYSQIHFRISGAKTKLIQNGKLKIKTMSGWLEESILNSYYLQFNKQILVSPEFQKLNTNTYGYFLSYSFPDECLLVIDPVPVRLWSTYYGGNDQDVGGYCALDSTGNIYMCGTTMSVNNIATSGSHQSNIGSIDGDAFLIKLNSLGQIQWGTYYGGTLADQGFNCTVSGNFIYLVGETQSSTNISTPGSFQPYLCNLGQDGFLAKFNLNGERIWGTYYGGDQMDRIYSVAVDDSSYIYFCGETQSDNNIASSGAHQQNISGAGDGFLVKFDSSGQRVWGTYYGGNWPDRCYCIVPDGTEKLYLTGFTQSTNNIATSGSFQPTYNSGGDAFLVRFTRDGERIWGTYFGGSLEETGRCVVNDKNGMILLAGVTNSLTGLSTSGSHQPIYGGGINDGFLGRFDTNSQLLMCTYYGGNSSDFISDCYVADNNYIYFTGRTGSTNNISTPGAFQDTLNGDLDIFIAKFDSSYQRVWGTYFGTPDYEQGNSLAVNIPDTIPLIYISGQTSSDSMLATLGAHQPYYGGGTYDTFLALFKDCQTPANPGTIYGLTEVCIPISGVSYSVASIPYATAYLWILPPGAEISSGQNTDSITVDFGPGTVSGSISVRGINACGEGDSSTVHITAYQRPVPELTGCDSICNGFSCTYFTVSGQTGHQWLVSSGGIVTGGGSSADTFTTVLWGSSGNQWVNVNYTDTNGCEGLVPTFIIVEVTPEEIVDINITSSSDSICIGSSVTFSASSINTGTNQLFQWFINGVDTNYSDSIFTYIPAHTDTVYCVVTSFEPCRSNNPDTSNVLTILVLPELPVSVTIAQSANPVCEGDSVTFTATPTNGGSNPAYQWKVNGVNVGINQPIYTFIPLNGDSVRCILTSNEPCTSNNPASSILHHVSVYPLLPVNITISASKNPVCEGTLVTFTAIPTNGGTNPTYQWKVNGINVGTNQPTYSYIPSNGDSVRCILTSSEQCTSSNPASSNPVIMGVKDAPVVTFTSCFDTITTTNAKPIKLKGGIPLGGIYSGAGVSSGYFYPSMAGTGSKVITYSYTNAALCSADSHISLFVFSSSLFT